MNRDMKEYRVTAYIEPRRKVSKQMETLSFKKKKQYPTWMRHEPMDYMQRFEYSICAPNETMWREEYRILRERMEPHFFLTQRPIIGRTCIGLLRIEDWTDLDCYIWI